MPRLSIVPALRSNRGAALIVSVGVLAVLLVVAISFSRLMVLEREATKNNREYVQARMAAESGIEHAVAWLRNKANFQPYDGLVSPISRRWMYKNNAQNDVGAGTVDLRTARFPSFQEPISPIPASGIVPQPLFTYPRIFYKLKVIDTQSQINLNGTERLVTKQLESLGVAIEALGKAGERPDWWIARYGVKPLPNPLQAANVKRMLETRKRLAGETFTTKEQIRRDASGSEILDSEEFRLVQDYVAVNGWWNERAIVSETPYASHGNPGLRYDQTNRSPASWWRKAGSVETILPRMEPRHPININTAPKAVLIANLMNLDAYWRRYNNGAQFNVSGMLASSALYIDHPRVGTITFDQAKKLAEAIIQYRNDRARGPFRTWEQFVLFLRNLPTRRGDLGFLTRQMQDMLIANACPNLLSNIFLPEPQRYFSVSKDQIFGPTSEFCFDSRGSFEISSLGFVRDQAGQIIAEVLLYSEVKLWQVLYRESQRDWLGSMTRSQNVVTGPESIYNTIQTTRSPATTTDPLVKKVYGDANVARGGSPYEGWLQALTEEFRMSGSGYGGGANFTYYGKAKPGQTFFAPYLFSTGSGAYDAQASTGPATAAGEASGPQFSKSAGETVFKGESLAPDGVLCQNANDEELSYAVENGNLKNFDARRGTLEFWIKLTAGYERSRDPSARNPLGAHEPIFYMNHQIQAGNPAFGVTWKLERYGYRLRSTRFFWMTPVPQLLTPIPITPVPFLWSEVVYDINRIDWKDGEWHHIVHSWKDFTDQLFFVDGKEGLAIATVNNDNNNTLRFELVSIDPQLRAFLGGFMYQKTRATGVYRGFSDPNGWTVRVGNCKIDQLRGLNYTVGPDDSRVWIGRWGSTFERDLISKGLWPQSRFNPRSSGGSFFEGEFAVDAEGEAVLVAFTTFYPQGYGSTSFVDAGRDEVNRARTRYSMRYTAATGGKRIDTTDSGRAARRDSTRVKAGDKIQYRIDFDAAQGANYTPIVDDLTIFILVNPVYHTYRQVFER